MAVPSVGYNAEYLPITFATNKPVIILQSRLSMNYWYLNELSTYLQSMGAETSSWTLKDTREGFEFKSFITEREENIRYSKLPNVIPQAIYQFREKKSIAFRN